MSHALVVYGLGAELGDFKQFADDLITTDLLAYKKAGTVTIQKITNRDDFFDFLKTWDPSKQLKELHIFSHSIGAALYLGYKDPMIAVERQTLVARLMGRKATYLEVLRCERGAILTDDFVRTPYAGYKAALRPKFTRDATIKIWGCNAGVKNWQYSDPVDATGSRWTSDPNAAAVMYYWRALNEQNTPKPSIAQAMADYFGATVKGALSGANIEVKSGGKWISSDGYRRKVGHYPGPKEIVRLQPTKGRYSDFAPAP